MSGSTFPFTLEQEARYRQYLLEILDEEYYQKPEYQRNSGVLVNMAVYELVKLIKELGYNPAEDDVTELDRCAEFCYLAAYIGDWLEDEEFQNARKEVEDREKQITGKVSDDFGNWTDAQRYAFVVREGFRVFKFNRSESDWKKREKKMYRYLEQNIQDYAERMNLDVQKFRREVNREMNKYFGKKSRQKPKGFGKS